MAEVDWAQWAIEAADGFQETKWQNIGVAPRQLAHELISTRARLTTAEQERDQWEQRAESANRRMDEASNEAMQANLRAARAEARRFVGAGQELAQAPRRAAR